MKRTCNSTILLFAVAALYFCVAAPSSADTLEVECYAYVRNHGFDKLSCYLGIDQSPYPLDIKDGPKWNEGPLTDTRDSFNRLNYDRTEFTAGFAKRMVKRKLILADFLSRSKNEQARSKK